MTFEEQKDGTWRHILTDADMDAINREAEKQTAAMLKQIFSSPWIIILEDKNGDITESITFPNDAK